jgi:hypothetical protein
MSNGLLFDCRGVRKKFPMVIGYRSQSMPVQFHCNKVSFLSSTGLATRKTYRYLYGHNSGIAAYTIKASPLEKPSKAPAAINVLVSLAVAPTIYVPCQLGSV